MDEVKTILSQGIKANYREDHTIYLSPSIYTATGYANVSGEVPVVFVVPMSQETIKGVTSSYRNAGEILLTHDILPEKISHVLTYMEKDGVKSWYRLSLNEKQEMIATPWEEYLANQTAASAASQGLSQENMAWQKRLAEFPNQYATASLISATEKYLIPAFPSNLLQGKQMLYRGQGMSLAGLQQLLREGILRSSADANTIPFSYDSSVAIHHSRGGEVPVLFGYAVSQQFIEQNPGINQDLQEVTVDHAIALSEMDFVAAYLTVDGKEGWYQVSLDQNGQIQTTPLVDHIATQAAVQQEENTSSVWSLFQEFFGKISNAYHKAFASDGNLYSSFIPGMPQFLKFIEALGEEFSGGGAAASTQGPVIATGDRFTGVATDGQNHSKVDRIPLNETEFLTASEVPTITDLQRYDDAILGYHVEQNKSETPQQAKARAQENWNKLWGTVFPNWQKSLLPWRDILQSPRPTTTEYVHPERKAGSDTKLVGVPENVRTFMEDQLPKEIRGRATETVILNASDWHGEDITEFILVAEQFFKEFGRENVIVLFGGDGFTGSYLLNKYPMWGLSQLIHMGVDVFTMGNHEADVSKTFLTNLGWLKFVGSWKPTDKHSRVASGPAFIAGQQRMLRVPETLESAIGKTLPYVIKITGTGERVAVIALGKAGYGNKKYPAGKEEEAQEDFQTSLNTTVAHLQQNNVDHIVVLMHEALNDHRIDSRAYAIAKAIDEMPADLKKLVRVVYEGHTHNSEDQILNGIEYVQGKGFGQGKGLVATLLARDEETGKTYVATNIIDALDRSAVPVGQEDAKENPYSILHKSMGIVTENLQREAGDMNQPVVKLVGDKTSRTSHNPYYVESAMANATADGLYWKFKRLSRETDVTGRERKLKTRDNKPIEKWRLIGFASYMNTGKPLWKDEVTLSTLTDNCPNPEPPALRPILGRQFIQFMHDNFVYTKGIEADSGKEITATFACSHNIRIAVQGLKVIKNADGKEVVDTSDVQVFVYILSPEDKNGNRHYVPMKEDETYYLAMPHHMMVGLYEAAAFKNTDLYGSYDAIYVEQEESFSEMMGKFFAEAAAAKGYQTKKTPTKWYGHKLNSSTDENISKFKTYYWKDANGTWKELTAEDEDKFMVLYDNEGNPDKLLVLNEQGRPVIDENGKPVTYDVKAVPLFYTHVGRIVNLDELLKGEKTITQKTLDKLYNGTTTWEEVFGPIAAPEADPTELPGEDNPSSIGGAPAASPAGAF